MFKDEIIKTPKDKVRVSGVILVDKPKGMTSQQVVSKVKYLFKSPHHDSKKAGHTGTLDPMATGLLPICMGEATKFSHYQLDADKSYTAVIKLGVKTDTGDAEGKVISTKPIPNITQKSLDSVAEQFTGDIRQIPPMYSALKKDGKKLYEYARAGIEVERQSRPITIKALSLTLNESSIGIFDEIVLTTTCTKGTYIRVLGEDIAEALGTYGHLTVLRRTQVGYFNIDQAVDLATLERQSHTERFSQLLPTDSCVKNLPKLVVDERQYERLSLGQRLNVQDLLNDELIEYMDEIDSSQPDNAKIDDIDSDNADNSINDTYDIRLFTKENQFIGLGKLERNGRLQPKKMIQ